MKLKGKLETNEMLTDRKVRGLSNKCPDIQQPFWETHPFFLAIPQVLSNLGTQEADLPFFLLVCCFFSVGINKNLSLDLRLRSLDLGRRSSLRKPADSNLTFFYSLAMEPLYINLQVRHL